MDRLDQIAQEAQLEAEKEKNSEHHKSKAEKIRKKLQLQVRCSFRLFLSCYAQDVSSFVQPEPAMASHRPKRASSPRKQRGDDCEEETDPNLLVQFHEGDISKAVEEELGDEMEYNEGTLKAALEALERANAVNNNTAEAFAQLQSHRLSRNAKLLLLTQEAEMDTSPTSLVFLHPGGSAAIDLHGLNQKTLPVDIAPSIGMFTHFLFCLSAYLPPSVRSFGIRSTAWHLFACCFVTQN